MPDPTAAATDAAPTLQPLRRLLRYARPHRGRVWAASACSVLNKLFDLMPEVGRR